MYLCDIWVIKFVVIFYVLYVCYVVIYKGVFYEEIFMYGIGIGVFGKFYVFMKVICRDKVCRVEEND